MNRNQHGQQMLPAERFGEEDQAGKVQRQSGHHDGAGQDPLEVLDQQMWATLTLKGDVTQAAKQIEEKKSFSTEYGIKTHKELNDFLRDAGAPEASLWQLHKYLDQTIFKRRKQEAITRRALLMSRHQWDGVIDPLESLEVDEAPAVGELSVPLLREVLAKDIHAPQKKIAACVDRSELRELFATSFIELFRAVGSLQRVIRSNLGRVLSAAKRVVFAKEDIAVRFLQSKVRRLVQGTAGRRKVEAWRSILNEGALDKLPSLQDGDTIVIPAGDHFTKVTTIAEDITSIQTRIKVKETAGLFVGEEIEIGNERVKVLAVRGSEIQVRRRPPSILFELLKAVETETLKGPAALVKAWGVWQQRFITDGRPGLDAHAWRRAVTKELGRRRNPDMAAFAWLAQEPPMPDLFPILHRCLHGPDGTEEEEEEEDEGEQEGSMMSGEGEEGGELVESRGDVEKTVHTWWTTPQRAKRRDSEGARVRMTPSKWLREDALHSISLILLGQVEAGLSLETSKVKRFLGTCLEACPPKRGSEEGLRVLPGRFKAVAETIDDQSRDVFPHTKGTVVGGSGEVRVGGAVTLIGEPGTVLHCTLLLGAGAARVFKRKAKIQGRVQEQLLLLYESPPNKLGRKSALKLSSKTDQTVLWDAANASEEDLHVLLEDAQEVLPSLSSFTIRAVGADAVRAQGGVWELSHCKVQSLAANRHDALVAGLGAVLTARHCTVGGADGKTCRYAVGVASGSRVVLEASSVQLADQAALRCGANAAVQLQKRCQVVGCNSLLDCVDGRSGTVLLTDLSLAAVRSIWADAHNRPDPHYGGWIAAQNVLQYPDEVGKGQPWEPPIVPPSPQTHATQ